MKLWPQSETIDGLLSTFMAEEPLIVAITGSIGSGKSLVGSFLGLLGATVIDADQLAREVVAPGQPALEEIRARFGMEVFEPGGTALNRKELGRIVFGSPDKRRELEKILHPKIRSLFKEKITALCRAPSNAPRIIAYLVPLLFESGFEYDEIDIIVTVSAPREACIERVMSRDRCTRQEAEKRLSSQLPIEEKEERSDIVLRNSGSPDDLSRQVDALYMQLSEAAAAKRFL